MTAGRTEEAVKTESGMRGQPVIGIDCRFASVTAVSRKEARCLPCDDGFQRSWWS